MTRPPFKAKPFVLREWLDELYSRVIRTYSDLHRYQLDAVDFLHSNPFSALFIDLGLGKTAISATLIARMFDEGFAGPWLIIAPKRVARQTWPNEFREWHHIAHLSIRSPFDKQYRKELKDAGKLARDAAFKKAVEDAPDFIDPDTFAIDEVAKEVWHSELRKTLAKIGKEAREHQSHESIAAAFERNRACIHVINKEQVEHIVRAWGTKRWPYKHVIIDESQYFKSYKSARFKALAAVRPRLKRLHLLTATPAAESYIDLFAQIWLLDMGKRLTSKITHFRNAYCYRGKDGYSWKLIPGMEQQIASKIADICLTMRAEDYLDLEKPLTIPVNVKLPETVMKQYRKAMRDAVIKVDDKLIVGETAPALQQKLMQIASGFVYDENKQAYDIHDNKIETLRELIESAQGQPILVSYWHNASRERLKKAFSQGVVMDADGKCIADWNAGKIPLMFVQPASAGAGLNLQHGGHILVVFDMFFSNELYTQLVGRLARQGQKNVVLIYLLMAVNTVDEIARIAVIDKQRGEEMLKDFLIRLRAAALDEDVPVFADRADDEEYFDDELEEEFL